MCHYSQHLGDHLGNRILGKYPYYHIQSNILCICSYTTHRVLCWLLLIMKFVRNRLTMILKYMGTEKTKYVRAVGAHIIPSTIFQSCTCHTHFIFGFQSPSHTHTHTPTLHNQTHTHLHYIITHTHLYIITHLHYIITHTPPQHNHTNTPTLHNHTLTSIK